MEKLGIGFAPAGTLRISGFAPAVLHISIGRKSPNRPGFPATDRQFDTILRMAAMLLDGCEDLAEAKAKFASLLDRDGDPSESEVK